MSIAWPADPNFVNDSERRVWTALFDQLGPNDLLIANQRFTDRKRDYEIDCAICSKAGVSSSWRSRVAPSGTTRASGGKSTPMVIARSTPSNRR